MVNETDPHKLTFGHGHHMPNDHWNDPPDGQLGAKDTPHTAAPADWDDNGLPYGAWCKCGKCGYIGRSTLAFDYYRRDDNTLDCETCARSMWTTSTT